MPSPYDLGAQKRKREKLITSKTCCVKCDWLEAKIKDFDKRITNLEKQLSTIDNRTIGSGRIGGRQ